MDFSNLIKARPTATASGSDRPTRDIRTHVKKAIEDSVLGVPDACLARIVSDVVALEGIVLGDGTHWTLSQEDSVHCIRTIFNSLNQGRALSIEQESAATAYAAIVGDDSEPIAV